MPRVRSLAANISKLFDAISSPVYILDDKRKLVYGNQACAAWLGVPIAQLIGVTASYHSQTEGAPLEILAAGLCPPPETFGGTRAKATVSAPTTSGDRTTRHAEFLTLRDETDEVAFVLAIVDPVNITQSHEEQISEPDGIALHEAVRNFRQSQLARYRVDRLVGTSPSIIRVRQQVQIAIRSTASVLLVGPAGCGKQEVAKTIHYGQAEPSRPLVPLDCSVLGGDLLVSTLEATLKGHPYRPSGERTGTLLLNEIDQLPVDAQRSFNRLLGGERLGLRLIATATRPLDALVSAGEFRRDLAYAISTLVIELPSLANRLDDLPLLAQLFLENVNATGGKQVSSIAPEALDILVAHRWRDNLDELVDIITEAHAQATTAEITARDLPKRILLSAEAEARPRRTESTIDLEGFLAKVERELIERALGRSKGNKTRAAKLLGMTRPRFYRRLVQLGMVASDDESPHFSPIDD